jgi:hypothetical protein
LAEQPRLRRPPRLLRELAIAALGIAVGLGVAVVVGGGDSRPSGQASVQRLDLPSPPGSSTRPAEPAATPIPARSPQATLQAFLQAQARGDFGTSYGLLDRAGHRRYDRPAAWVQAQADRLQPVSFRVGAVRPVGAGVVEVGVEVTHRAAIDPFVGLTPGRTRQVWRIRQQAGRWRIGADPVRVQPLLPSDRGAPAAVQAWVERLLACDDAGAGAYQAEGQLYGPADLHRTPCQERGRWTVAAALGFDTLSDPQPFVAAFGPEVATWARLVPVQGPRTRFVAVVVPLGEAWRVLGAVPP